MPGNICVSRLALSVFTFGVSAVFSMDALLFFLVAADFAPVFFLPVLPRLPPFFFLVPEPLVLPAICPSVLSLYIGYISIISVICFHISTISARRLSVTIVEISGYLQLEIVRADAARSGLHRRAANMHFSQPLLPQRLGSTYESIKTILPI